MFVKPKKRSLDSWGEGFFGAPRGDRTHNGIDYKCPPKTQVFSSVEGIVTKLGYPYSDNLNFRYVEITDAFGMRHRIFYVSPKVELDQEIKVGDLIGITQKLGDRYAGITEHFHYEIMTVENGNRKYFNPENDVE